MSKTPFIRPLQVQGGTFYSFSSSAEDITSTFNNSESKFKFSKYALLNIPNINTASSLSNEIKLNAPDGAFLDWASNSQKIITGDGNVDFSQSFQSYCLNVETTIISSDFYSSDLKQNVSERIFFKWMKEIGAMRFKNAPLSIVSDALDQNTITIINDLPVTEKRFVEGDPDPGSTGSYGLTGANYEKVVKYIGNLDIVNSVKNNNNAYSEVYVHVPTKDGNTPSVLFKNVVDLNYYPDYSWANFPIDPLDKEYLSGRAYDENNPSGLTNLAIFDQDAIGVPSSTFTDTTLGATGSGNWYSPRNSANSYYTDNLFTDPTSLIITKSFDGNNLEYARTKLDSIGIDFDPDSYKEIINNPSITTIEEFNSTPDSGDFSFNCVLIYYDVYDPSNISDYATNLYGVLFLDDVITDGDTYIPRLKKYKPNIVTKLNGNSYGFKINLKFDVDIDQTGVEQAINDYSPFSLTMFMDAMNVLQDASSTLNNSVKDYLNLQDRVTNLEDIALSTSTTLNLSNRITSIENALSANQAIFENTQSVMGLINQNYDLIRAVINNETSAQISYDLDSIKQGSGVIVDRSVSNQVTLKNSTQDFNIGTNNGYGTISTTSFNDIILVDYTNYFKHINNGNSLSLESDVVIRIDDSNVKWKRGQSFRISFGDEVLLGSYFINIYTDSSGMYPKSSPSGVTFSRFIATLDSSIFNLYSNKPVIDIVCIDDQEYKFQVDVVGTSLTNNA
jgi:hypothetical protein